jgi:tetratricopeptide (TPR) repeat protein
VLGPSAVTVVNPLITYRAWHSCAVNKPILDHRKDAIGSYDQTAYLFHISHVLYEEKDFDGSIKALKQSIRLQPKQERQGRVHPYAVLAQRQLRLGHLDAACESWFIMTEPPI